MHEEYKSESEARRDEAHVVDLVRLECGGVFEALLCCSLIILGLHPPPDPQPRCSNHAQEHLAAVLVDEVSLLRLLRLLPL
jgi:hypothetical protein